MRINDIVDIESAKEYIYDNFNLNGTCQRMVYDILDFVHNEYNGKAEKVLYSLLYNIGLTNIEIKKIASVL